MIHRARSPRNQRNSNKGGGNAWFLGGIHLPQNATRAASERGPLSVCQANLKLVLGYQGGRRAEFLGSRIGIQRLVIPFASLFRRAG